MSESSEIGEPTDQSSATSTGAGELIGADTPGQAGTTEKDPSEWVTGDEPMTGAQRSYLDTLARAAGEQLPADLTKAQASEHIERLQAATGRGSDS
ncbi:MAG TPA: DUF3072 domain-containing protein [Jatrophihabitans sp.]|nr:DUF3072 domain-containing protein [Jatrophihabitans sp.]